MAAKREPLDLTFLGSGNAFAPAGRAFSSFLVNGRYLFDCGPTVLQQLHKAGLSSDVIDLVLISISTPTTISACPSSSSKAGSRSGRATSGSPARRGSRRAASS